MKKLTNALFFPGRAKTSRPRSPSPPRAPAQGDTRANPSPRAETPSSPLSSASTADEGELSSPILPSLPAPKLPEKALERLRTPPQGKRTPELGQYSTASWGSPYPAGDTNLARRAESSSSETSEESPLHQLEINTPFLRPVPLVSPAPDHYQSLTASAAVLANRARRPLQGITEDWIRQHTTSDLSEHRHWLSDGTDESEHSSLSGSVSGEDRAWLEESDPRTPRAILRPHQSSRLAPRSHPGSRSSNETLRHALLNRQVAGQSGNMESLGVEKGTQDAASIPTADSVVDAAPKIEPPMKFDPVSQNGSAHGPAEPARPRTPVKAAKPAVTQTPRLKKKVPWRGKNIMVLLPRDEGRGQPGKAPMPLDAGAVESMLRSWEELGYNIRGFDLDESPGSQEFSNQQSQSRGQWPDLDDVAEERSQRKYQVTLPDLKPFLDHVKELQEAKLRALGVLSPDEPAPPSSNSPAPSNLSRQPSNQFPGALPFSPPLPPGSTASNGAPGFPFPGAYLPGNASSAAQSPGIPATASPFNAPHGHGRFNPRGASISISPNELPFNMPNQQSPAGWSPQLFLQNQLGRTSSPSMLNMNSLVSPVSPYQRDGISPVGGHGRNQSLQYPMLPHQMLQRQDSARASPRLQELREDDEEVQSNPYAKSESKTPEPAHFIRHNASDSLQREIDDAEYHLEEQFRSQLEHEDYSPHNEAGRADANKPMELQDPAAHARGPSVHFGNFGNDSDEGPKLHHPRPHSRGHSLSQKPFFDNEEMLGNAGEGGMKRSLPGQFDRQKADDSYEIETNPSNLGTPVPTFDFMNQQHDRSFSNNSNPWADAVSFGGSRLPSRRTSHASKASLSKLNAGAAEFKFNPTSNFTPGQFVFGGGSSIAPNAQPASVSQSVTSSHMSMPSTSSSKINVNAPSFSPRMSEFSFSAAGPSFNPGAKAFQPLGSLAASVTSAGASGNESADNRPGSIFGKIDLSSSTGAKASKKSKAIPIVRPPSSRKSPTPVPAPATSTMDTDDQDGRPVDARTKKKARDNNGEGKDGDDMPLFAEPTPEPELPQAQMATTEANKVGSKGDEPRAVDIPAEVKADEDENANVADTTIASTILSESTDGKPHSETNDSKATTSPSATSPDQEQVNWRPFEFTNENDVHDFNMARPFGDVEPSIVIKEHKRSLSASAKAFEPSNFTFGAEEPTVTPFEPLLKTQPQQMASPEETDDDRAGSPTPGPDLQQNVRSHSEQPTELLNGSSPEKAPPVPPRGGLDSSRFASPPPAPKGLKASRFASSPRREEPSPSPAPDDHRAPPLPADLRDLRDLSGESREHSYQPLPVSPPSEVAPPADDDPHRELTFEEIDEVMKHISENDKRMAESRAYSASPMRTMPVPSITEPRPSTEVDDSFMEQPQSAFVHSFGPPVNRLNLGGGQPDDEKWEDAFSASEQDKLEQRAHFFDGQVNRVVGNLLGSRFGPLERTLETIQRSLGNLPQIGTSARGPSARRDRRSVSAEFQESDADDEDDEAPVRRSLSPKRDRRLDQIRMAVMEAMNQQQPSRALQPAQVEPGYEESSKEESLILKALQEMKEQFSENLHRDRVDDIRKVIVEAVENRMPPTPRPVIQNDEEANNQLVEMQHKLADLKQRLFAEEERSESDRSRVLDLEQKLRAAEERSDNESMIRRGAEDRSAELRRQLDQAETKVEVEIMNRSIFEQRIHDLEDRLKTQEGRTEFELSGRREAEDRLSEIQRLLRISSEEEDRLRMVVEERDHKIRGLEQATGTMSFRINMLEAATANAEEGQTELKNRLKMADAELRDTRQEVQHWRSEADHARHSANRQADDVVRAMKETKHLHKLLDTLTVQLQENERIRDSWRAKFNSLQDDMAHAAREISEENHRRTKKEQALIARQEVLDARLQAEARTRERIEVECERLENGERAAFKAVSECKRLEGVLADLRNENHALHQRAANAHRELAEARDSASVEIKRALLEAAEARDLASTQIAQARETAEADLLAANKQVSTIRMEMEEEVARVRAQLDQVRMDADTAKAHHDMMLEEAETTKKTDLQEAQLAKQAEIEEITRKYQNEIEDLQTKYERQITNATEDAQRTEQNLLERLSLSTSKSEHLQDRVAHLEDKVLVAQEAAKAAAQAASQATKGMALPQASAQAPSNQPGPVGQTKQLAEAMQLPEKISPQALRESIMVLQEQLQAREQRIEELEQTVTKLDPEAPTKISKRDDEITWLRELLAVRHGDLQDIIRALSADSFDRDSVKDAAIRLKANLQMEEQERERAMNGGSAINLPNIAASIQKAATPRVAQAVQAVGPLAAAWGNWRKSNQFNSSPRPSRRSTPSKPSPAASQSSLHSGLMTPPASGIRTTPSAEQSQYQPTAFGNTGRRLTAEEFTGQPPGSSLSARQAEKMPLATTPPHKQASRQEARGPSTPLMHPTAYDNDARGVEDFDDASFFDDY
ncbi:hypothetical protein F4780DRAFT_285863 [Xylariomycetidae sp. FL0641]|nr:hypothetical protein F4780DRAFT_285863 [Xylariomycetidae sp. FL0641]